MNLSLMFCFIVLSTGVLAAPRREKRNDDVSLTSLNTLVQQQAAVIQTLQSELSATKNDLLSTKSDLVSTKNDLVSTKSDLQSAQAKLDRVSTAVAFTGLISAHDSVNDGVSLGVHQTIVFDRAITNIGHAYDTTTGVFTAPLAGSYVFFLTIMAPNNHGGLFVDIIKNGVALETVFAEGQGDNYDQGSTEITTHLSVGDKVLVRQRSGDAIRGDHWSVFTGYLLQAD